MGLLDTFELMNAPAVPFITLSRYGITFSKYSLEKLAYAQYVHAYIDRDAKQFAIQPCQKDEAAIELVSHDKPNPAFVRWGNRKMLRTLVGLAGINVNEKSYRINGVYYKEEDVIIYDLLNCIQVN